MELFVLTILLTSVHALARTGKCPECSILNGDKTCHCNWTGFCLLLEMQWNNGFALDNMHTEKGKVILFRPVGKGVHELVLLPDESSMFRNGFDVHVAVLVCFNSFPSFLCLGICSHLDDHGAMHLIVPDYYLFRISAVLPCADECTVVGWRKGAFDFGTLIENQGNKSLIIGTGLNQVTTVQIGLCLQKMGHDNIQVWLSRNGPAVQFVIGQLRSLKIQFRLFPSESALLSLLGEFLDSDFVDNIYCACTMVDCGKIIDVINKTMYRPSLAFFDLGMFKRVARQFYGRIT